MPASLDHSSAPPRTVCGKVRPSAAADFRFTNVLHDSLAGTGKRTAIDERQTVMNKDKLPAVARKKVRAAFDGGWIASG